MTALFPPLVLQLIAKEADREVACGPTAAEDILISDIKAAAAALGDKRKISEITMVTEVFRQNADGNLLFTFEHMGRYARKLETSLGIDANDTTVCGSSFNSIARLMGKLKKEDEQTKKEFSNGRFIRLVSWGVHEKKNKAKVVTLAYCMSLPTLSVEASAGVAISTVFDPEVGAEGATDSLKIKEAARALAMEHKEQLGIFDSCLVSSKGVVYDGARCRLVCVAEGSVIVPLNYTPAGAVEDVLGMDVSLLGLKSICDQQKVDFRTVDLSIGHLAMADCFALISDDHDIVPVAVVLVPVEEKEKINAAFLPAFVEQDGFLILRKVVTPVHTALIDKINRFVNAKGYKWGDDLSKGCPQQ